MLKKDIEDISSRLEEAGSNTATQVELNKKREAELGRIKAELEELNIAQEGTLAALRMKHNNTMGDLGEQIDTLNANKVILALYSPYFHRLFQGSKGLSVFHICFVGVNNHNINDVADVQKSYLYCAPHFPLSNCFIVRHLRRFNDAYDGK